MRVLAAIWAAAACVGAVAHTALASIPAALPRAFVDTHYVAPTGATITVRAGEDFQAALDRARPGDQVVLPAGATFTGNFVLPAKPEAGVIVVRSSGSGALPEGVRATPAQAAHMARIVTPSSAGAIATAPAAHGWRLVGIELTVAPSVSENTGVVRLGVGSEDRRSLLAREIVIDRCWIHGNPTQNDRRGVALNGISEAVIDSTVSDFHEVGYDAQAIAGWNGPGPFEIADDELEASGENVLFGGADPAIAKLVPSDIEVRHNRFFKPLSWRVGDPSYAGIHWTVKNIFELKNARRVLLAGNVLENSWGDAQTGFAINLKSANQEGGAPWSVTQDVTLTDNLVRHAASAISIEGRDPGGAASYTNRVTIVDSLFEDINGKTWKGAGDFLMILAGSRSPSGAQNGPGNVFVDHNTALQSRNVITSEGAPSRGFTYTDNITPHNRYGVKGSDAGTGLDTLKRFFPGSAFDTNVLIGGDCSLYPPGNFCPRRVEEVGFVDPSAGDYRPSPSSPYRGAARDGSDIGADVDAIEAATGSS